MRWQRPARVVLFLMGFALIRCDGLLSFGTEALRFELDNSSQLHWGCLSGIHLGGDPSPTPAGILDPRAGGTPVWQLTATSCNASFPAATVVLQSCTASCSRKYLVGLQEDGPTVQAHLRWAGCNTSLTTPAGLRSTLDVDIFVNITGAVSAWSAVVGKQNALGVCLQSLSLPDLRSLRFSPGSEELFVPYMFGAQTAHPDFPWGGLFPEVGTSASSSQEMGWMPNGWERTMSWTAWLSSTNSTSPSSHSSIGLYLGVHDPKSRLKMMPAACNTVASGPRAVLRAVHVPHSFNDASTSSYTVPYQVVIAGFNGGWWDAAQIFRGWALNQADWASRGNLSIRATKTDIPLWVLETPLWVRLSGDDPAANSTLQLVEQLKQGFRGSLSSFGLHWYSWNQEKFDSYYPIYNAKPGFGPAVTRMQSPTDGVYARVVPYTNGRIWDPSGPLHSVPAGASCLGADGQAYHEVYGSGVRFTLMDPASSFMHDEWSTAVGNISQEYNTSGIYTDQISCARAQVCYSTQNSTNASAWATGSRELLNAMSQRIRPGSVLISESQDQTMLAQLDAFLTIYGWLGTMQCSTALGWQAVYSGWSVNVGDIRYPTSPSIHAPSGMRFNSTESAAHRAISAQVFVSGGVMGWYGASLQWQNSLGLSDIDMQYTRLLAKTKLEASQFLVYGRLWRQPVWQHAIPSTLVHDYSYMEHDPNQSCPTPNILAECWQAEDGSFAVVATNHGEVSLTLNVTVDLSDVGAAVQIRVPVVKVMMGRSVAVIPVSKPWTG